MPPAVRRGVIRPAGLVQPQRLRVHADELGGHADHVLGRGARSSRSGLGEQLGAEVVRRRRGPRTSRSASFCARESFCGTTRSSRTSRSPCLSLVRHRARRGRGRAAACPTPEPAGTFDLDAAARRASAPRSRRPWRPPRSVIGTVDQQVVAAPLEQRRGADAHRHQQVAGRAAVHAVAALAGQAQLLAVLDAGRDADDVLDRAPLLAAAVALGARVLDRRCRSRRSAGTARRGRRSPGSCERTPRPSHSGQTVGLVPGAAPEPCRSSS